MDRFADTDSWKRLQAGEPVFPGVYAWLRGKVVFRLEAGNSTICIVHVIEAQLPDSVEAAPAIDPLVYHARTWHSLNEQSTAS